MASANKDVVGLKPSEIKELIKQRYRNRHIKTRPVCLVGHKGIGKTDIIRQVAEELCGEIKDENGKPVKVVCKTLNLQFCDPPDFLGLPIVRDDELEGEVTRHARPELMPGQGEYVIWLFDEANRCQRDNRAGMLTLLQDRRVNKHIIGSNVLPVLAMNPSDADGVSYEVQEFDAALEDRIAKVWYKGDFREFLDFMTKKYGDDNSVVRWIANQPDIVDFKGRLRTSPRGLDYLADAIKANGGMSSPHVFNVIAAEVGMDAAHSFQKFMKDAECLKAEHILDEFGPKIEAKLAEFEKKGRNDILNTLIKAVCIAIVSRKKLSVKASKNLIKYLEFIAKDSKAAFFLEFGAQTEGDHSIFEGVSKKLLANSKKIKKFLQNCDTKGK